MTFSLPDHTEDGKPFTITVHYNFEQEEEATNIGYAVKIEYLKAGEELIGIESTSYTQEQIEEKIMDYEIDKIYR